MTVDNKSEYAAKRLLDSQNLGPRERLGLHRPVIPLGEEPETIAAQKAKFQQRRQVTLGRPQPRDAGN